MTKPLHDTGNPRANQTHQALDVNDEGRNSCPARSGKAVISGRHVVDVAPDCGVLLAKQAAGEVAEGAFACAVFLPFDSVRVAGAARH
ncbi:MAG: hypothetical protein KBF27_01215 [Cypionkella sp.]|nr:hypothetical protein [Cypionkella sp.]